MPEDSSNRPFLWSEIHSIAKERLAQLDATIRAEIGKPKTLVPEYGAERNQFFLLLEEKANSWGDRARDAYEDCLNEIGRANSFSARSSVFNNGLSFFLSDNLRAFLYLECGCYVERPYTVRRPGQPRTFTTLKVRGDVRQVVSSICDRVRSRINAQFTGQPDWRAQLEKTLAEIQPQLQRQSTPDNNSQVNNALPAQPTRDNSSTETVAANQSDSQSDNPNETRRREIDNFMNRVLEETGHKISRADIYRAAGYKSRREFERWQKGELRPGTVPDASFARALSLSPEQFVQRLETVKRNSRKASPR